MIGRSSGILLPIFSLPGEYGIGSLGKSATNFIDFLALAHQKVWQILPLVPPGSGDSPYMSPSAFAGNPLLIDLDLLAQHGLLTGEELAAARYPNPDRADYAWLADTRLPLLRRAYGRRSEQDAQDCADFAARNLDWLPDHALFTALHAHFDGAALSTWPAALRRREPAELENYTALLSEEVDFHVFLQYIFFQQWAALRAYAKAKNVAIMGDLPIYVSADSADLWRAPALFQVDADLAPTAMAGVPPDAFSDVGQHWGNPLYNWAEQEKPLFSWWLRRMKNAAVLYDMLRIDHFRGLHTYWSIPAAAAQALEGHWEKGPGQPLLDLFAKEVPSLALIAEDLGDLDDAARAFIAASGLPGMKILIYAFDPVGESSYLPHNCLPASVVYTGTHDTPTFLQWLTDEASPAARDFATNYLRLRGDEGLCWGAICGAWSAASQLAIAPLQDVLGLGSDARVNFPGTVGAQNWSWRVRADGLNADVAAKLRGLTRTYRRG